ncbi:unnamed protein product [Lymnaea stagnalis]|uniref:PSP proline-rich domain-containing protein n=1 Tax=Lymnaea stagnalis TaxID=6523 RepID=A0AAV2H0X5_LYMST
MQRQMLEQQERQQHMQQGNVGPGGPIPQDEDLMMKVRHQQQMLDMEKQREAQQKLMEQQQIALMEAHQMGEQQRMLAASQGHPMAPAGMPPAAPIRSSGVSMVTPRGPPPHQGPHGQPPMPPTMMQGGPPPMPPVGGPQMMQGGPPPMPPVGPPPMLQSGPPLMPPGGGQPMMQSGPPPMSQGGPHLMSGPPPPMPQGGPNSIMLQGGAMGMGDQQQMLPSVPPPPMPQDIGDRQSMFQGGPPQRPPPGLMSLNMRPDSINPPVSGDGGPLSPNDEGGPRSGVTRGPYNGPSTPVASKDSKSPVQPPNNQGPKEMRLPQALEKMLEFKSQRATELGVDLDSMDNKDDEKENNEKNEDDNDEDYDEDDSENKDRRIEDVEDEEGDEVIETNEQTKESKNKRRKKKKKKARKNRFEQQKKTKKKEKKSKAPEVQIEYVQEQLELDPSDPNYHTFARIFEAFKITEPEKIKEIKPEDKSEEIKKEVPIKAKAFMDDDDDDDDDEVCLLNFKVYGPKISKKKLKKLTRLTVAQLKQLVNRPDVVEMHDVTARDPRLLVHLKATRNSVPVPRHWCYKRKYLQGKRGIEKTPFELPDFIKATGIEEMRAALQEKEDQKTLKSKMREKVRPKMGKIDIDYQKLHDAFFRFQTKPKMTIHGDLYYEAKEFETKLREKKPGNLSDDLKMALGMPIGNNSEKVPPPWLIAMQRYGPPPSYPNLKIPGLNAPIPDGCMFGYHAGGWGKPPVDEHGKPLYGDVFGTQSAEFKNEVEEEEIDKTQWGELESESESEEESEEEEEEDKDETGLITPAEGLMTPGGITSVPLGMETPDQIELRKRRIEDAMDQGGDTPALYQVLPEKKTTVGGAMMGSAHVYDISAVQKKPGEKVAAEAVEVSLNPEELDLDTAAMQAKYEQTVREQQSQLEKEDLSDMVAAHAAKQRKRKKAQQDTGKGAKKYKDFKF